MKKSIIIIVVIGVLAALGYAGYYFLYPPKYEAKTSFAYSVNNGKSYQEGIQVIQVDTRYYLSIEMQVAKSSNSPVYSDNVDVTLKLPKVTIVDDYLFDNPGIRLPREEIGDFIVYNFKVIASTNPQKFRVIIEFVPNQEGLYTIQLEYGKQLNDLYDKRETIRFDKK